MIGLMGKARENPVCHDANLLDKPYPVSFDVEGEVGRAGRLFFQTIERALRLCPGEL